MKRKYSEDAGLSRFERC